MLAEYERLIPCSAERIIIQFEEQGWHRRRLEAVVTGNIKAQNRGQIVGATIALAGMVTAIVLMLFGLTAPASL